MRRGVLAVPREVMTIHTLPDRCAGCAALAARVAVLEAIEAARQRPRANTQLMGTLLAAIAIEWGYGVTFLAEHLHEGADPNVRFILKGRSVRGIGKLLAGGEGRIFDGRVLVAEDPIDGRRRWSVRQAQV